MNYVYVVVETIKEDFSVPSLKVFASKEDSLVFFRRQIDDLYLDKEKAAENISEGLIAEYEDGEISISVFERKIN